MTAHQLAFGRRPIITIPIIPITTIPITIIVTIPIIPIIVTVRTIPPASTQANPPPPPHTTPIEAAFVPKARVVCEVEG